MHSTLGTMNSIELSKLFVCDGSFSVSREMIYETLKKGLVKKRKTL